MQIAKDLFDKFPVIETERLILRDVEEEDAENLFEMLSDVETMQYFGIKLMTEPDDAGDLVKRKKEAFQKKLGIGWILAKKDTNEAVGFFNYLFWFRQFFRTNISYLLHKNHWRKGYMSEAFPPILKFGFEKMAFHRIEAVINPSNKPSYRSVEKIGFQREAVMSEHSYNFIEKKFEDMCLYALLKPNFR